MNPRTPDRVALGAAVLCLAVLGLRPTSERVVDPTMVVVRAPGSTDADARGVADSLGGVGIVELAAGAPLGIARQLHVVGWGLEEVELRQVGDRQVVLHPRALPDGIRAVSWTSSVALGAPLEIRATVRTARSRTLTLVAESGQVDSVVIPAGELTEVVLHQIPRAAGIAQYVLRLGSEVDTFSVSVTARRPPVALLLASAPAREWSDLRDWFAAQGGTLVLRTTMSRDRSRLDRVNVSGSMRGTLDGATLARTSVVVTDGRTLARLTTAERSALRNAVREGLGLIVILDRQARDPRTLPAVDRALFLPWTTTRVADLDERQVRPRVSGVPISATPIAAEAALIDRDRFATWTVVDDGQDGALAAATTEGAGRVVGTLVTGAGRWRRGGEDEAFGTYWSALVHAAARPDPLEERWELGGGPLMVDRETAIGRWGRPPGIALAGGDTLTFVADPLVPGRTVAHWWPRQAGWNDLDGTQVWVAGRESWLAWRAADRRRATERWIDQHRSAMTGGAGIPVRVPWPRWPFFIGFVVAAGWLWRVRR